jgi:4-amino-4-deoxy-L-arabinose transferase-like glycosyltransferase
MAVSITTGLSAALLLRGGRFTLGGACLVLSVLALRFPPLIWKDDADVELPPRLRRLAVLAVCLLAAFFRTYQIAPPGLWGDEAVNGLRAFDVLDGKVHSPFELVEQPLTQFHALCNYPIAAAFWAFGASPTSLRLPGIIAGILDVPLLFGTFSPLFGSAVAVVAATFFASSPWQITHAKGLIQIEFGEFFLLLGMCLLVRGVTGKRRWLVPLAGVPLAGCLYTYHAARLAPLVPAIFLLAALRKGPERGRLALWSGTLLLVFVACAIPAALSYVAHPGALTERVKGVGLWQQLGQGHGLGPLWDSMWRTLMIFQYQQGPVYNWFGIGADPALNLILAFLFVHGLVESLWHCTVPRHVLLLAWLVVGLIPGCLSTEAPRAYRIFLGSPPLYVWAALPLVHLYRQASRPPKPLRWLRGVAMCMVVAVPLVDFNYYFYRLYTSREFRWFQATRLLEMGTTLKALGPGWVGEVIADSFTVHYETMNFAARAWGLTLQDVRSLVDVLPIHDEPPGGVLFIVDRSNRGLTPLIQSMYPSVEPDVRTDPPLRTWWFDRWLPLVPPQASSPPTVTFFAVSRRMADSIRGLSATFLAADGRPLGTRVVPALHLESRDGVPSGPIAPTQVKCAGALYAPLDGGYQFKLTSAAAARVWIDDRLVVSDAASAAGVELAQGLHRIAVDANITESYTLHLLWQPPGAPMSEIPRAFLFRNADVHGLLALYDFGGRQLRRVEPYPYYAFFSDTFSEPFSADWRARLHVPPPGNYRLEVASTGATTVSIDERPLDAATPLPAGDYDLTIHASGIHGAARLQIFWQRGDQARDLVPPEAFTPPFA